ncbi:hydrogenase maturation protease [candidate division WOR-3 bacterium]|nr:hydrogenase maturation protease [candidate division WOR-3 bacterium]
MNWKDKLKEFINKNTVIMGIGSELKSDDRVGVYIADSLSRIGCYHVIVAGQTPEHWMGYIANKDYRRVLIVDAVVFGGNPGEIRIFGIDEISERFGLTHSSSLHLFCGFLAKEGSVESVRVLAIEPETLKLGDMLSSEVKEAADKIIRFFKSLSSLSK